MVIYLFQYSPINNIKLHNIKAWPGVIFSEIETIYYVHQGLCTIQSFLLRFFQKNCCTNHWPYIKLLKKSLQLWKNVVVCMDDKDFFWSFSCSVRGPSLTFYHTYKCRCSIVASVLYKINRIAYHHFRSHSVVQHDHREPDSGEYISTIHRQNAILE